MLAALLPVLGPILDRTLGALIPDPQARQKFIGDMFGQLAASDLAQMEVNKAEAGHRSIFVAGWRPAIGWVCAAALFYQFLLLPALAYAFVLTGTPWQPPVIGLDEHMWELLMGMLGMGALRSLEKLKGVAK